jgi:hypothetical protein
MEQLEMEIGWGRRGGSSRASVLCDVAMSLSVKERFMGRPRWHVLSSTDHMLVSPSTPT